MNESRSNKDEAPARRFGGYKGHEAEAGSSERQS